MDAALKAESIFRKSLPADHPDLARTETIIGQILTTQGRYAEAEQRLRHALATRPARLARGSPHSAAVAYSLGMLLEHTRRFAEAESLLAEASRSYRTVLAPTDPRVGASERALQSLEGRHPD